MLIALGGAAAFFSMPSQVSLQARPPAELKGRMVAVMNQANFFAIVMSGVLYMVLDRFVIAMDWPRSTLLAAMALLFLPVAIFYRLEPASKEAALQSLTAPSVSNHTVEPYDQSQTSTLNPESRG